MATTRRHDVPSGRWFNPPEAKHVDAMVYTENEDGDEDGCVILYSTGTVVIQRGTGDGGSRRTFRE